MKPEIAVFSTHNPCTKLEIWQAFRGRRGFLQIPVAIAHSIIGKNVPRIMERNGYLVKLENRGVETVRLTPEGEAWLLAGFKAYLKNHPDHRGVAANVPSDW